MTYIDFDKLKRVRDIDPFSVAPIEIQEALAVTGEVMRDNSRADPAVMAQAGVAMCRVTVDAPTPRLRQRLAILGWLPCDPADDHRCYLAEPVELSVGDNHVVADFVAKHYAEGMNLLFAPHDGMFAGAASEISLGAGAQTVELRERVRLLAERVWVAQSFVVPFVPVFHLVGGVGRAVARENAARERAGLPLLAVPSQSTLGRWAREFRNLHSDRAGIGRRWCSYEGPGPRGPKMHDEAGAVARITPGKRAKGGRTAEPAKPAKPAAPAPAPASATRAARARVILETIRAAASDGRWESIDVGNGGTAREWVIDCGEGLEARLTTRFSGVPMTPSAEFQQAGGAVGSPAARDRRRHR